MAKIVAASAGTNHSQGVQYKFLPAATSHGDDTAVASQAHARPFPDTLRKAQNIPSATTAIRPEFTKCSLAVDANGLFRNSQESA